MRVMTVTCDARPFAVLRALGTNEAVSEARAMAGRTGSPTSAPEHASMPGSRPTAK